jgi:hypothetical protein
MGIIGVSICKKASDMLAHLSIGTNQMARFVVELVQYSVLSINPW